MNEPNTQALLPHYSSYREVNFKEAGCYQVSIHRRPKPENQYVRQFFIKFWFPFTPPIFRTTPMNYLYQIEIRQTEVEPERDLGFVNNEKARKLKSAKQK